jgi:hypothetical protein
MIIKGIGDDGFPAKYWKKLQAKPLQSPPRGIVGRFFNKTNSPQEAGAD